MRALRRQARGRGRARSWYGIFLLPAWALVCLPWSQSQRAVVAFAQQGAAAGGERSAAPAPSADPSLVSAPPAPRVTLLYPQKLARGGRALRAPTDLAQQHLEALARSAAPVLGAAQAAPGKPGVYAGSRSYLLLQQGPPGRTPSLVVGSYLLTEAPLQGAALLQATVVLVAETGSCYLRAGQVIAGRVTGAELERLVPGSSQALVWPQAKRDVLRSPVRLVVPGSGPTLMRARLFHELAAARSAESLKNPIVSSVLAEACTTFAQGAPADGRLRVHRDLVFRYGVDSQDLGGTAEPANSPGPTAAALKALALPLVAPRCELGFAPFGQRLSQIPSPTHNPSQTQDSRAMPAASPSAPPTLASGASPSESQAAGFEPRKEPIQPWSALACLSELATRNDAWTESLDRQQFKIVQRRGRWVTLEASRTSGLVVGTRLVGPGGAQLHVIRVGPPRATEDDNRDNVTAYVRSESASRPLAPADMLELDTAAPPSPGAR